ncbi:FxsB family cyclophane-forming radical SAM/SPASM peptide maturase [Streptomyces bugieae]|uniref:FxsB family cyclophane-forming radical SAM/SPASM peptide maturase n=1 Tax=Streptomyces bugieae TaxID=3098223 RepID=A0ABU7NYY7_9ACTN|nr:FxsB family cyclophane-forming radical SAM/SPASM peptide maturase [Streptomyces sp. DSM 41528]
MNAAATDPHGPAPWPHALLDVAALRRAGARPVPFRQFVLKVHSRCNLACTYCYVYHGADSSWRSRPHRVGDEVLRRTAHRIAEHVAAHDLTQIRVELHGGEPLLSGPGTPVRVASLVRGAVHEAVGKRCAVRVSVQTNGTLLTERTLSELAAADIGIGVSLDGGAPHHNTSRVDHAGRPSWPAVTRGLRRLARYPASYAGILCTVDLAHDPVETYASLLAFDPPAIDLLLPHANWAAPPPGIADPHAAHRATPYADWLAAAFDAWFDADRAAVRVRLFTEVIGLLLGVPSAAEAMGISPLAAVVVDTDGAVEQVDSLKTAYEGAPVMGLHVDRNSFDDALEHPGTAARQLGMRALAPSCRTCPVVRVCGGGNYAHRYRPGSGFRHPSVYCADLAAFIRHVDARLQRVLVA